MKTKKVKANIFSGFRKEAKAVALIKEGSGKILINKKPYQFFDFLKRLSLEEPIRIARNELGDFKFDITVKIRGGGKESQIEAARQAIARALVGWTKSESLRKALFNYDKALLVSDVRRKETYKPGDSKARKKRQKSYR